MEFVLQYLKPDLKEKKREGVLLHFKILIWLFKLGLESKKER